MDFTYESVNNALYNHHPELSSYWTFLGWEGDTATATYTFDSNEQHVVIVRRDGTVEAPDEVMEEMDKITEEMSKVSCNS